jgi:dTDP-4-dehydrorhamnose 3,5-epimerase
MTILVTGGAGFIGANFVLDWLAQSDEPVINLDKLTYAGNRANLVPLDGDARHVFVHGDMGDRALVASLLAQHRPRAVLNFAAESHVDRSIHGPADFIQTNIVGTFNLLECVREHWGALPEAERAAFRFLHVSTDEVYGSRSAKGVLRGLHYQLQQPQGKLVRVVRGAVFDVAVDIRRSSPTFGQWVGCELSEDNHRQFWVPPGFAHGFVVLSDSADFLYKTTDYYAPAHERCIAWDDPDIGIEWPLVMKPLLSAKDKTGALFRMMSASDLPYE